LSDLQVVAPEHQEITEQSAFYRDLKRALKYITIAGGVLVVAFLLYRLFSLWLVAGILITLPYFYLFIGHILHVPKQLILSLHIATDEEDTDGIGIYYVPKRMLEDFTASGGSLYYVSSFGGEPIAVVDEIDFEHKTIESPWFSELSNIEFFRDKLAFINLKKSLVDEIRANTESRALMSISVQKGISEGIKQHFEHFDKVMNYDFVMKKEGVEDEP